MYGRPFRAGLKWPPRQQRTPMRAARGDVRPSWLVGQAVNEIRNLPTSAIFPGSIDADVIDAWGSLALIDGTNEIVSAANGGHGDAWDNGVYSLDVAAESPAWVTRIASSVFADVLAGVDYYADGKPTSAHGYTHLHYIAQRGRVIRFGGEGTYPNADNSYQLDGVRVSNWTWDCITGAETWAALAAGRGFGQVVDPNNGNVWTNGGWLWDQAADSWSQPGTQTIGGSGIRSPMTFDTVSDNIFSLQWRDGRNLSGSGILCHTIDRTTGVRTSVTINTSSARTQFESDQPQYAAMVHDPVNDCFYFYSGQTFNSSGVLQSNVPTRIYKITKGSPNWDMSTLSVTGDTPGNVAGVISASSPGINKRVIYLPDLYGFAGILVIPSATARPWFMRTS